MFRSRSVLFVAACMAASFAPASAGEPNVAPPSGIVPTKPTLTVVLAANKKAEGEIAPSTAKTRVEHWKVSSGSLTGTDDEWHRNRDFRVDSTLGPDHTAYGYVGGRSWQMNANGQISYGSDIHQKDAADRRALRSTSHAGVSLLGEVSQPVSAYVVKIDPPNGRLKYVFFDKTTFLIDRTEQIVGDRRVTTTYDDYRKTKGLYEAWHVHSTDGFKTNDTDYTMTSLAIGEAVADADLAVPAAGAPILTLTGTRATLPAKIDADRIVVPMKMGGHTVDFLMDSGSSDIVIDRDVVEALKIKEYGQFTSETAGTYVDSSVIIPEMTCGPVALQNVHATSLPFEQWTNDGKPIAGLLGYDFISTVVWHVDYANGTLEAIDPSSFTPPAGGHGFDVTFDDNVPTVAATLAGIAAPSFILDTGADRSALFSVFLKPNAAKITDQGLGEAMEAAFPFVNHFSGVGGTVEFRQIQAGPFALGPWTFPKWLFYATQNAASFEFEDYDGLIGQDLMRNFDLYLDYPHSKVYLVPNDRFRQRWAT